MKNRYKVTYYGDGDYRVMENVGFIGEEWEFVFRGSLADCEAYIRLHEGGYMGAD